MLEHRLFLAGYTLVAFGGGTSGGDEGGGELTWP